jgi:predicted signal transduction protein with EAL and GGDEF domain
MTMVGRSIAAARREAAGAVWHTAAAEARYGGEEFAIVLPGRDRHGAVRACEAARERVDHHPWYELAPGLHPTVSVGVAHGFGAVIGRDRLVAAADRLLYAAKRAGGNGVAFHDAHTGLVRLAGPAARRRSVPAVRPPEPHARCMGNHDGGTR